MVHSDLLVTLVTALVAAFLAGFIAVQLRLPPIVGYLAAGVAIGPFTPGGSANAAIASELAEVGVILLMFGVGLHFSLSDLLSVRKVALPGAIGQVAVATTLGAAAGWWWGWGFGGALVFGLSLSVASTVVLLRALESRSSLTAPEGKVAVGWLIVEDLFTVLVLVLLPALAGPLGGDSGSGTSNAAVTVALALGKAALFAVLMLVVGARVLPRLLARVARTGSRELFTLCVLAIALGAAYGAAELFTVSLALGAFLAGMIVGESELGHQAGEDALPMRDAFAVLFFVSVGMLFDPSVLVDAPGQVATVLAIVTLGKAAAAFAIVAALGHPLRTGLTVAAGLAQVGEFSFILMGLGGSLGLLPSGATNLVLAGAIVSILLNPVLFALGDRIERWQGAAERRPLSKARLVPWLVSAGMLGAAAALAVGLPAGVRDVLGSGLFLLSVLLVARRWGRAIAIPAAGLGALLLLIVVTEPHLSLAVSAPSDYAWVGLTLAGMLLLAWVIRPRAATV